MAKKQTEAVTGPHLTDENKVSLTTEQQRLLTESKASRELAKKENITIAAAAERLRKGD